MRARRGLPHVTVADCGHGYYGPPERVWDRTIVSAFAVFICEKHGAAEDHNACEHRVYCARLLDGRVPAPRCAPPAAPSAAAGGAASRGHSTNATLIISVSLGLCFKNMTVKNLDYGRTLIVTRKSSLLKQLIKINKDIYEYRLRKLEGHMYLNVLK